MKNIILTITLIFTSVIAKSQVYEYKLQDVYKTNPSNREDSLIFVNVEYTNPTLIITKKHTILKSDNGTLKLKNQNSKFYKNIGFKFKPEGICGYVASSKKLNINYEIDLWIENGKLDGLIRYEKDGLTITYNLDGNLI